MVLRNKIKQFGEVPISRYLILSLLANYKRPNDKISELLKNNSLISIRRGMYITGPRLDLPSPDPFLIANHLRGPSYVSLDSALSYWGMIPERAFEISSITIKTSKLYKNAVGRFSYHQLKIPYYSFGIKHIDISSKQTILIASPEKALCDKLILTPQIQLRSIKQTREFLIDDLRISMDDLRNLDTQIMELWIEDAPKKASLKTLIKMLQKL